MELYIAAFAAGILTVLAPCILPLLPVVIGTSSIDDPKKDKSALSWVKPVVITVSLGVSVILFTLLLKATTALLNVPTEFWATLSGGIIVVLGVSLAFPHKWETLISSFNLSGGAQSLLGKSSRVSGHGRNIATGFALGPVFNSCSPTYLFIVATILPAAFFKGLVLLFLYTFGLCGTLLIIAYGGQAFVAKLEVLSNPNGIFKRVIGTILIVVGIGIIFSIDKSLQTYVLEKGWYDPISNLEKSLR